MKMISCVIVASILSFSAVAGDVNFPARDMPPRDVVVCGGGPAGCAAAIAARRSGLGVLLVEAQSRLGGTATSGGVSHWLGGRNDAGEWVVGGIFRELSLGTEKNGAAILPKHPDGKTYQPYAWLPWFIHGVVLDSDRVAMMLDEVMSEEDVEVLFETRVVGVEKSGERITHVIAHAKDGFRRIPAKVVIDATGDADVANFAGCPVLVGRDGDHLTTPASLTFHLSHVDGKALWDEIERTREPKFRPLIEELKRKGEWPFPYDIFISVKGLAEDEVMINTMRLTEIDGTSAESRTKGYVRGRREAYQLLDILHKHFPGFKNAQMKSIAPMLGVRESRRIDGEFKLTVEDLRNGAAFPDTIGYSMYGWDLPDPKKPSVQPMVDETGGGFVNKAKKQLVTPIPYRVMVPRGCSNLLCPGRAVSVERDVLGPLRVMAPCMAMGEACGVASRQIARGTANSEVDVPTMLAELRRRGCIVDKSALPVVRPRVDPATGDASRRMSHVRGRIAECEKHENLHPRFAKAFEFMRRPDLAELPCGRYEIDGSNCWAMVQEVVLKPFAEENKYEVHRAFIDIQAPISGSETFGVAKPDPKVFDGFDTTKDYVLFNAKGQPWTLEPGEFAIFFPENGAHAPGLSSDGPRTIRKLVIKVGSKSAWYVQTPCETVAANPPRPSTLESKMNNQTMNTTPRRQ